MANKLKVQEYEAIRNLQAQGWGIRRISRHLALSRNTVRSFLRGRKPPDPGPMVQAILSSSVASPPDSHPQTDPLSTPGSGGGSISNAPISTAGKTGRSSLCVAYADVILAKVELGLTAQRIYQDLTEEGPFSGSYQSVKRYVHRLRQLDPERIHRIEVQPGEEVQVDFGTGPVITEADGRKRKTWIFRIVLSCSRKGYAEAVFHQNTETFIRCLENAFRHFGGVPLTVNLDNLKAAVIKADWADPELNPKLVDFARHYGTSIFPCLPRTPEHKGKVENSVKYVKENALAGRKFDSLATINRFLLNWEQTVADQRIHGTTKRQVAELFALEKPSLLALPGTVFPCFQEAPRSVHRDGYVEVAKAFYHVPQEYLRRDVWVRFDAKEVRIFVRDAKLQELNQIQFHLRLEPGQFTNARGIGGGQGSLQKNLNYWLGRASNLGTSCDQWAQAVVKNRGIEGMRSLMGLVALVNRHSFPKINQACERAHAKGSWRLRDVKALLQTTETQTEIKFDEHHPLIRNLSEYGLFIQNKTT